MPERSTETNVVLEKLRAVASNRDCWPFLEQAVNSTDSRTFVEADLEGWRREYDPDIGETLLESLQGANLRSGLTSLVIVDSFKVPTIVLCLFVHVLGRNTDGKLIACQADVNGKRFVPCSGAGKRPDDSVCSAMAVPYLLDEPPDEETDAEDVCRILPMRYEETILYGKQMSSVASGNVTSRQILSVFEILFGQAPEDVEDESPPKLLGFLLKCIEDSFQLLESSGHGWIKLLMAIVCGTLAVGPRDGLELLNDLQITNVPSFTLALFSSMIPIKLGFLSGEVPIAQVHSFLVQQNAVCGNTAATKILQQSNSNAISCIAMKRISNTRIEGERGRNVTGSLQDFCLEILLEQRTKANCLQEENKGYTKGFEAFLELVACQIDKGAKHNPHLRNIFEAYRTKQREQGTNTDGDEWKAQIVGKYKKRYRKANGFAGGEGPKDISILLMILTEFHDKKGAKAMGEFLCTDYGKLFLPSGSVANADLDLTQFRGKWNTLHHIRIECATQILRIYEAQDDRGKLRDWKPQSHRFGRRLAPKVLSMVAKHGTDVRIPIKWEADFPVFSKVLKVCKHGTLHAILLGLLKAIVLSNVNDNDVIGPVSYGNTILESGDLAKTEVDKMELGKLFKYGGHHTSPFKLVAFVISGDHDDLLQMIEDAIKHEKNDKEINRDLKQQKRD
ncbi:unnamed protein product, partial [Cylindrotheca closterium]